MGKIGECGRCGCQLYNKSDACPSCNGDLGEEDSFVPVPYTKPLAIEENSEPISATTPLPTEPQKTEKSTGLAAADDDSATDVCPKCGASIPEKDADCGNCFESPEIRYIGRARYSAKSKFVLLPPHSPHPKKHLFGR